MNDKLNPDDSQTTISASHEAPSASSTTVDTTQQAAIEKLKSLLAQVNNALVGQQQVVRQVVLALLSNGHVLLEGVPGLGKTLLVRALAKTFDGDFKRIQFTPDLMPSDVTGHVVFDMQNKSFQMNHGPVFTNLLLADEIKCRKSRSLPRVNLAKFLYHLWFWQRKTRLNKKEPILCRKQSSTGF